MDNIVIIQTSHIYNFGYLKMYILKTYSVGEYTVLKFYCNKINLYSRSGIFKFLGEHGQGKNTIVG